MSKILNKLPATPPSSCLSLVSDKKLLACFVAGGGLLQFADADERLFAMHIVAGRLLGECFAPEVLLRLQQHLRRFTAQSPHSPRQIPNLFWLKFRYDFGDAFLDGVQEYLLGFDPPSAVREHNV